MISASIVRKVRLGDDVLAYCGRCKEERQHQVVSLDSAGGIERVSCRTCHSNHRYREQQASSKKPGAAKVRQIRSTHVEESALATGLLRSYSPQEAYSAGDRIAHSKFGMGKVAVARPGKIDVKFGIEVRTLVHAG